jgi:hypothetical protein
MMPSLCSPPPPQTGSNLAGLKQFVDYALKKPDVYLVTMRQLIGEFAVALSCSCLHSAIVRKHCSPMSTW